MCWRSKAFLEDMSVLLCGDGMIGIPETSMCNDSLQLPKGQEGGEEGLRERATFLCHLWLYQPYNAQGVACCPLRSSEIKMRRAWGFAQSGCS